MFTTSYRILITTKILFHLYNVQKWHEKILRIKRDQNKKPDGFIHGFAYIFTLRHTNNISTKISDHQDCNSFWNSYWVFYNDSRLENICQFSSHKEIGNSLRFYSYNISKNGLVICDKKGRDNLGTQHKHWYILLLPVSCVEYIDWSFKTKWQFVSFHSIWITIIYLF